MYLLGYSIDNLSLMALTIGTGFVVDDAVVVLENIVRHLEAGLDPKEAALRGSAEVGFTVISMSLSLIAVVPADPVDAGIVGLLFHEFAVVLSIAILFSLVISLTITPTMCAYVLSHQRGNHMENRWARAFDAQFERFKRAYSRSLDVVLDHALLISLLLIGLLVANVFLFRLLPGTFFPEQGHRHPDRADHRRPEHLVSGDGKETRASYSPIVQKDPAVGVGRGASPAAAR